MVAHLTVIVNWGVRDSGVKGARTDGTLRRTEGHSCGDVRAVECADFQCVASPVTQAADSVFFS